MNKKRGPGKDIAYRVSSMPNASYSAEDSDQREGRKDQKGRRGGGSKLQKQSCILEDKKPKGKRIQLQGKIERDRGLVPHPFLAGLYQGGRRNPQGEKWRSSLSWDQRAQKLSRRSLRGGLRWNVVIKIEGGALSTSSIRDRRKDNGKIGRSLGDLQLDRRREGGAVAVRRQ